MNAKLSAWLKTEIKLLPLRPRQKRPPPPWIRWVARVFQWVACLLLLWFVGWRVLLYRDIEHRFAALRAAGLPASGQELNTWRPPVPDAENGALILPQAFALARTFPDRRSNTIVALKLLERTNQWPTEIHEMVAEYVLTNALAIAKAREAENLPHFRFAADFAYGPETELPQLGCLKNLARIVALKAALAAEEGRADEWADQTVLLLHLASTIEEEPTVISHLVRNAMVRMAVTTTERGLNHVGPGEAAAEELQANFARIGETNLLPRALMGERAMMIPMFRLSWSEIQNLNQHGEGQSQPRKPQRYSGNPMIFFWLTGFFERDLNFYLQTMDKGISLAQLPPPANLMLTNELDTASQVAHQRGYLYSAMILPAFSNVARREASTQAQLELAQVAMAVERFHNIHGTWPENLMALRPHFLNIVPSDPFDGQPLRYHRLEKGFVVYSVGPDGEDNGGRERPANAKSTDKTHYDITFTVER